MSTTEVAAFQAMQTDIQVSMDDVVSAFVSEYENNLYTRKKELGAAIRNVEKRTETFMKGFRKAINGDSFTDVVLPFDLEAKVGEGAINWGKAKVEFSISISRKGHENRYGGTIVVVKTKKIPAAQVKAYEKLEEETSDLRSSLGEILVSLKSVARKERQVRGRIAVRKLEDSGYANLMKDSELAQLVQLED